MICVHCSTPVPDGSRFCSQCGADPSDPGSNPRPTARISGADLLIRVQAVLSDQYDVKSLLGQGGMGAVYLAEDRRLERPVAVKVLPPEMSHNTHFVGRFEREARTAAKLDHANIIPIYAVESKDSLHYIVMKYVTGRSLDHILQQGMLPTDTTQRILWECACALGHAHRRGIIHRDVKPANIMIEDSGHAIVMDFGISKALEAATQLTATGQVIGTPHYMSPEQSRGTEIDGRSDIYSLGVVAYRMLTGQLPFGEGSVHTIIYKQIFEEPTPVDQLAPRVPPFLATAAHKAMAKEPADRFATMEEFASAVWPENRIAVTGQSHPAISAPFAGPSSVDMKTELSRPSIPAKVASAPPAKKSRTAVMVGVGGAALALAVVAMVALGGRRGAPANTTASARAESMRVATPPAAPGASAETSVVPAGSAALAKTQRPSAPVDQALKSPAPVRTATRTEAPPPAAPAASFLTINATPFGTVYVDGAEVGDTPVVGHVMTPGRHIVEIRREGYRTVADTVQIMAGNTTRLNKTLIKEQP